MSHFKSTYQPPAQGQKKRRPDLWGEAAVSDTVRSKYMAQIPKGRLEQGPYKPKCRDCAMYLLITVQTFTVVK